MEQLTQTLDYRLTGLGQPFGSSGTVNVTADIPFMLRDAYSAEQRLRVDPDGRIAVSNLFATEATAALVLAELRRRPANKIATDAVTVPAGVVYTTVAAFTTTVDATLNGFNADFRGHRRCGKAVSGPHYHRDRRHAH